jgi:hypothetical protein
MQFACDTTTEQVRTTIIPQWTLGDYYFIPELRYHLRVLSNLLMISAYRMGE